MWTSVPFPWTWSYCDTLSSGIVIAFMHAVVTGQAFLRYSQDFACSACSVSSRRMRLVCPGAHCYLGAGCGRFEDTFRWEGLVMTHPTHSWTIRVRLLSKIQYFTKSTVRWTHPKKNKRSGRRCRSTSLFRTEGYSVSHPDTSRCCSIWGKSSHIRHLWGPDDDFLLRTRSLVCEKENALHQSG